jgi:ABC-type multidrug transport system fused ATPase/permease subunit
MQLIMRFYDPDLGTITIDNINLKDIDLGWLR